MESFRASPNLQLVASLLCAVVGCVLLSIVFRRSRRKLPLPPGPRGLPIIGHLHLMGDTPHLILHKLSQRHGPLFSLRFGSVPVLVASSPQTARQILQSHDRTFSGRLPSTVDRHLNACRAMHAAPAGPYFNLLRSICATHLLRKEMLKSFSPILTQELGHLTQTILEHSRDGHPIPIRAQLRSTFASVLSHILFGDKRASQPMMMDLVGEFLRLLGAFNVSDYIPSLGWLDLQGHAKASKALGQKVKDVFTEFMNERRQEHRDESKPPQDFLDALLAASFNHNSHNILLTDDDIAWILMSMFAGGISTSPLVIEWALIELLANPEKFTLAKDELQKVVGISRLVQESDIPHLPYLQMVVKETFRLHPTGPILIPHYSMEHCRILDFEIPKNTLTLVNTWTIGRDSHVWENALKFVPERFVGSKIDVYGRHFELLPFGSGQRTCPGLALALTIVHLTLASLLHCFDWEKVGELDTFGGKFKLTLESATPLVAKAKPTMSPHVIEDHMSES